MREIWICIIIVAIIISLDIVMQNYTKKSTDEIISDLEKINAALKTQQTEEDLKHKLIEIKEKWKEKVTLSILDSTGTMAFSWLF